MKKLILVEAVLCVALVAGVLVWRLTRSPRHFTPQETVEALVALQPTNDFDYIAQLLRSGTATNKFDVNRYFTVLDALRPEPGYVLDWVYWRRGKIGGLPVLYIRRSDALPYANFENYVPSSTNTSDESFFFGYLDKIHVRDTPEGYFQLVVLRILGDRFDLFWHEFYKETFLVCSKEGWEAVLLRESQRGEPYHPPPSGFVAAAAKLDFAPRVRVGHNKVEVNVITYCPFEGLDLHYFAITRQYPHCILKHTKSNLLQHTQGFVF